MRLYLLFPILFTFSSPFPSHATPDTIKEILAAAHTNRKQAPQSLQELENAVTTAQTQWEPVTKHLTAKLEETISRLEGLNPPTPLGEAIYKFSEVLMAIMYGNVSTSQDKAAEEIKKSTTSHLINVYREALQDAPLQDELKTRLINCLLPPVIEPLSLAESQPERLSLALKRFDLLITAHNETIKQDTSAENTRPLTTEIPFLISLIKLYQSQEPLLWEGEKQRMQQIGRLKTAQILENQSSSTSPTDSGPQDPIKAPLTPSVGTLGQELENFEAFQKYWLNVQKNELGSDIFTGPIVTLPLLWHHHINGYSKIILMELIYQGWTLKNIQQILPDLDPYIEALCTKINTPQDPLSSLSFLLTHQQLPHRILIFSDFLEQHFNKKQQYGIYGYPDPLSLFSRVKKYLKAYIEPHILSATDKLDQKIKELSPESETLSTEIDRRFDPAPFQKSLQFQSSISSKSLTDALEDISKFLKTLPDQSIHQDLFSLFEESKKSFRLTLLIFKLVAETSYTQVNNGEQEEKSSPIKDEDLIHLTHISYNSLLVSQALIERIKLLSTIIEEQSTPPAGEKNKN